MRLNRTLAIFALSLSLAAAPTFAQNADDTKAAKQQLKADEKANKSQAKADKAERKALGTKQQKKADKAQDDANRKAAQAGYPPPQ